MRVHDLQRLDAHLIPEPSGEVRVFCAVRNEMLRLPYFIHYYRKKGVERFIFIDNGSTDGTREYLLEQKDCHVFYTEASFGGARAGTEWKNALLDQYGNGQWCLNLDADEILIWPNSEETSLKDLCAWLDHEGVDGLYTFLLDMYADLPIADAQYQQGSPFIDTAPLFDADYTFQKRVRLAFWRGSAFPEMMVHGGPRLRMFYTDQQKTHSYISRYFKLAKWEFFRLLTHIGLYNGDKMPHPAPMLFKIPLVKWRTDMGYKAATHLMHSPITLSSMTGILMHFKFFSDFHEKVEIEVQREQYFGKSIEYKKYKEFLEKEDNRVLFQYQGSSYYKDTNDLVAKNLMRRPDAYDRFVRERKTP